MLKLYIAHVFWLGETLTIDDELILEIIKPDSDGRITGKGARGSKDNLHFDHIIPYSKGGSSLLAENIQLLCARHNLGKKDKIE
jgi:hypothetical protein